MYKINLHSHTKFSDGSNTIREMAEKCKELGHCACVITDHCSSRDENGDLDLFSLSYDDYMKQKEMAKAISSELDFPIIIGIELTIHNTAEVLVFGDSLIRNLIKIRDIKNFVTISDILIARTKFEGVVILCHPQADLDSFITNLGHLACDGYEMYNHGYFMFNYRHNPFTRFKHLKALCNSDAHDCKSLTKAWNEIATNITTEKELIEFIQSEETVNMIVNTRYQDKNSRPQITPDNATYLNTEESKYYSFINSEWIEHDKPISI